MPRRYVARYLCCEAEHLQHFVSCDAGLSEDDQGCSVCISFEIEICHCAAFAGVENAEAEKVAAAGQQLIEVEKTADKVYVIDPDYCGRFCVYCMRPLPATLRDDACRCSKTAKIEEDAANGVQAPSKSTSCLETPRVCTNLKLIGEQSTRAFPVRKQRWAFVL